MNKIIVILILAMSLTGCKSAYVNKSIDTPLGEIGVNSWDNGSVINFKDLGVTFD